MAFCVQVQLLLKVRVISCLPVPKLALIPLHLLLDLFWVILCYFMQNLPSPSQTNPIFTLKLKFLASAAQRSLWVIIGHLSRLLRQVKGLNIIKYEGLRWLAFGFRQMALTPFPISVVTLNKLSVHPSFPNVFKEKQTRVTLCSTVRENKRENAQHG